GARAARPRRSIQRGAGVYPLHLEKSTPHALSGVPQTRFLYFDRRPGGWLQNSNRYPAQAGGHALGRKGRQRHHCPALQQAQPTLRGFLGTPVRAKEGGRMTLSPKSDVRPLSPIPGRFILNHSSFFRLARGTLESHIAASWLALRIKELSND